MKAPRMKAQKIKAPKMIRMKALRMKAPRMKAQKMKAPRMKAPKVKAQLNQEKVPRKLVVQALLRPKVKLVPKVEALTVEHLPVVLVVNPLAMLMPVLQAEVHLICRQEEQVLQAVRVELQLKPLPKEKAQ